MILFLISDIKNETILDVISNNNDIQLEKYKENNFKKIINDIKNNAFNHIENFIFDITNVSLSDEEIFNYLKDLSFASSKRISILSNKTAGDTLLAGLFNLGIYDFIDINNNNYEEIKNVLLDKNNKVTASKYYLENITFGLEKENKDIKNKILNIFKNMKKQKNEQKYIKSAQKDKKKKKEKKKEKGEKSIPDVELENQKKEKQAIPDTEKETEREPIPNIKVEEKIPLSSIKELFEEEKPIQKIKFDFSYIDEKVAIFRYYENSIGLYDKNSNNIIIDDNFARDDIIIYLKNLNIEVIFKENVLSILDKFKGGDNVE